MAKSGTRLVVGAAVICAAVSLGGLLTMTGTLRTALSPGLSAEVHLSEYPLPAGFGIEPQEVSDFLVKELIQRAEDDIALRLSLGEKGKQQLIEIVIPRLVSSTVVRDMVANIRPLANVLSVADFRLAARVVITNRAAGAKDVALTLPGALLAEADGQPVKIVKTATGLTAVAVGDMASGESRVLTVWLGKPAVEAGAGLGRLVLVGAAGGQRGSVWIYGLGPWFGADEEAMPVARWMIAGALLMVLVASALVLIVSLGTAVSRARQPRVSRV